MEPSVQPLEGFAQTGLQPAILQVLERMALTVPTPIQAKAIPVALTGVDIVGIAQTGTGKTLAFSLPILEKLISVQGRALILVPTRELALQVEESIRKVTRGINAPLRTVCLIGGMPMYRQIQDLRQRPRIIVATPGRLQDHMNQGTIVLKDVQVLVLDEADRMLDMGFAPQIKRILTEVPAERQTMLFSATMAPEIASLAMNYMQNPVRIEVAKAGTSSHHIAQEICFMNQTNKTVILKTLLDQHEGSVLVFTRTKHGATKLTKHLQLLGLTAAEIHSNRSLGQRRQALDGFKSGKFRVLVATDVAARGIDVPSIGTVINYDLPDAAEDYVHRIGRTGRAGKEGRAISFATHDQVRDVKAIERMINKALPLSEHSETPRPVAPANVFSSGNKRFSRGRSQGGFSRPRSFSR